MTTTILIGDCRAEMAKLEPESVHCVVTSPPYWGLRDYGIEPGKWGGDAECAHEWDAGLRHAGGAGGQGETSQRSGRQNVEAQEKVREAGASCTRCNAWRGPFGLEPTYQLYIEHSVEIFRAVKRILRADGTLWLNLGDSYTSNQSGGLTRSTLSKGGEQTTANRGFQKPRAELKNKDLCGIPWRVAFALQADGWYLRRDIIWHKPNPMPESTTDRCTTAHEYLFHFSKSERYYYDAEAIKEPDVGSDHPRNVLHRPEPTGGLMSPHTGIRREDGRNGTGRNKRSVWTVSTKPFAEAHFATFPPDLIEPCVMAGTSEHGCCPHCGEGWERITTSTLVPTAKAARTFVIDGRDECADGNDQGANRQKDGHKPGWINSTTTLGFYPTCACAGLPDLPPYPLKPREDDFNIGALHEVALIAWRADCALVTSEHTVLCARAKGQTVKPATIFDPFFGAGTTGLVAQRLNRNSIGCELNPDYAKMAQARLEADKMTKESGRRHMAKTLNKEKPWTAETLFAETQRGDSHAGSTTGDST